MRLAAFGKNEKIPGIVMVFAWVDALAGLSVKVEILRRGISGNSAATAAVSKIFIK